MFLAAVVTLTAVVTFADSTPSEQCAARVKSGIEAFVLVAPPKPAARDTLATATVCVVDAAATRRVASYHGELSFDSTAARVVSVEKPKDGMRVDNAKVAGSVRFAGAAPQGFTDPAFVTVTLRLKRAGVSPRLRLRMVELNATDGKSLLTELITSGPRP